MDETEEKRHEEQERKWEERNRMIEVVFSRIVLRLGRPVFSRTQSPVRMGTETSRAKRASTHARNCVSVIVSFL